MVSPSLGIGGAERMLVLLARGLTDRGHDVVVAAPRGPRDAELAAPVRRVVLPEHGRSPVAALRWSGGLARALRRLRPDVVHAHNPKATAEAVLAARVAGRPRVLATFQGGLPAEYGAVTRLFRLADHVTCVSRELADGLVAHGLPAARVTIVPNGVVVPPTAPRDRGSGRPLVVAVGRLVPQKNHERLLLAARRVPQARFEIVGDGPLRARLEARARELGVDVGFTGVRDDAPALMAAADLVAFSSDWEGLSLAALEALAVGTPVVSTPVEGMRELPVVVTESFDADELGDAIAALLADAPRRAELAAAGRRLVADRYSADAVVAQYERVYRELVSR
jgi:glycosyltransferase involved in cell wall biosynthesis